MWKYKGFLFPHDAGMLIHTFLLTIYYLIIVQFVPIKKIMGDIIKLKIKNLSNRNILQNYEEKLDKVWRGSNWILKNVIHMDKPCLRRSLVLLRWCCKNGIEAELNIGVCKEKDILQGHSWISVNGKPYKEVCTVLKKYTCVLKG